MRKKINHSNFAPSPARSGRAANAVRFGEAFVMKHLSRWCHLDNGRHRYKKRQHKSSSLSKTLSSQGRLPWIIVACALMLFHGEIAADIIYLNNGNEIQGEIIKENRRELVVRFPAGIMQIRRDDVLRIESESKLTYLLSEAGKHLRREDYDGAIELYDEAIELDPESTRAKESLLNARATKASQLQNEGRLEEARLSYLEVLTLSPGNRKAQRRVRAIDRVIKEADRKEAQYREALKRGHVAKAYKGLLDLYTRFPSRQARLSAELGEAALFMGHDAFRTQDWPEAGQLYVDALSYNPDLLSRMSAFYAHAKVNQCAELVHEGRFETLLEEMDGALQTVPTNTLLMYYRGLALHGIGRVEEAARAYLDVSGAPVPADLRKNVLQIRKQAEATLRGGEAPSETNSEVHRVLPGKFRKIVTDHFVVYHRNQRVGKDVARIAEQTYRRLYRDLGCEEDWYKPCEIYIYPDHKEFAKVTGQHKWTGGSHSIVRRAGVLVEHRIESFQSQPRLVSAIIPHEVTHAILSHRLNYRKNVPLWINEGFAIRSEPLTIQRHYHRVASQARYTRELFPLKDFVELTDYPEDRIEVFYAQSFSLANFLVEYRGLRRFLNLLEDRTVSQASLNTLLKRHYRIENIRTLERMWLASLKR